MLQERKLLLVDLLISSAGGFLKALTAVDVEALSGERERFSCVPPTGFEPMYQA